VSAPDEPGDRVEHLVDLEGLTNVGERPARLDGLQHGFPRRRREEHDRDRAAAIAIASGEIDAAEPRHHQVDEDQVGSAALGHAQRLVAVGGGQDTVALVHQEHLQHVADHLVVVDDQDHRTGG
jgi:hypothetical protein